MNSIKLIAGFAVALVAAGAAFDAELPLALALGAAYPVALLLLGFYLPAERDRMRRLLPVAR